ncbi:MAG TPA: hypothetical protein VFF26_07715 [Gallionella sp.]|nr:hypothetical protein [Gallionella sp.]
MIVQSGYGALAYSGIATSSTQRQDGKIATPAIADPAADQVTLSSAGNALAAEESNLAHAKTPVQELLIKSASSDPASAEKIAYNMAGPGTIFYDISNVRGGEPVNKLSSGRIIDDEYRSKLESEVAAVDAQRLAIYESEKAKGTDPLQILIKMLDFTNAQSQDYLEATGWGYQGSVPQ